MLGDDGKTGHARWAPETLSPVACDVRHSRTQRIASVPNVGEGKCELGIIFEGHFNHGLYAFDADFPTFSTGTRAVCALVSILP